MKRLTTFIASLAVASAASAQGVMITKNSVPTFFKGVTALTFGQRAGTLHPEQPLACSS